MSNIVFILGAGASAEGGCPVLSDFFDRMYRLAELGQLVGCDEDLERLTAARAELDKTASKASFDVHNLESVFSALEMAELLGGLGRLSVADVNKARQSLIRLINRTLQLTQVHHLKPVPQNAVADYPGMDHPWRYMGPKGYMQLAINTEQLPVEGHSIQIITFNYDVGLEIALQAYGVSVNYHLSDSSLTDSDVGVLKLHGSLNWFRGAGRKLWPIPIIRPAKSGPDRLGPDEPFDLTQYIRTHPEPDIDPRTPFLIPPTENKNQRRSVIRPVWKAAAAALRQANAIVAVGFSLPPTDQFFSQFFALSTLDGDIIRRFAVIDIDPQVEGRYRELLGGHVARRFDFYAAPFSRGLAAFREKEEAEGVIL